MEPAQSVRIHDKTKLIAGELRNAAGLAFTFLGNGSIFDITHGAILINQVVGNPIDGGLGNVYIRQHRGEAI
jgi:hypothetical protein